MSIKQPKLLHASHVDRSPAIWALNDQLRLLYVVDAIRKNCYASMCHPGSKLHANDLAMKDKGENASLENILATGVESSHWPPGFILQDTPICFKISKGAGVPVISEKLCRSVLARMKLHLKRGPCQALGHRGITNKICVLDVNPTYPIGDTRATGGGAGTARSQGVNAPYNCC